MITQRTQHKTAIFWKLNLPDEVLTWTGFDTLCWWRDKPETDWKYKRDKNGNIWELDAKSNEVQLNAVSKQS